MKKAKVFIFLASISVLIYFLTQMISLFNNLSSKKLNTDLKYVKKYIGLYSEDSLLINMNSGLKVVDSYNSQFLDNRHFSYIKFTNNQILLIRKLYTKHIDLNKINVLKGTSYPDLLIQYDIEESYPFNYKIDVERKINDLHKIIVNCNSLNILKQNSDTILVNGQIFDISIISKNKSIKEGLYLIDESPLRDGINMEFGIFNKNGGVFLFVTYYENANTQNQMVQLKKIINKMNS